MQLVNVSQIAPISAKAVQKSQLVGSSMYLIPQCFVLDIRRLVLCGCHLRDLTADDALPLLIGEDATGIADVDGCLHLVPSQHPQLYASMGQALDTLSYPLQARNCI